MLCVCLTSMAWKLNNICVFTPISMRMILTSNNWKVEDISYRWLSARKNWLHCVSIALTHRYWLSCVTYESTLQARKLSIADRTLLVLQSECSHITRFVLWVSMAWFTLWPGHLQLSWVRVVLGTSCPGYELSWVRVVLGTSCPGYELSWVRIVQILVTHRSPW